MALFERLKELRLKFAKRAGVPAFVIFTDATLRPRALKAAMAEF
ncbi:HRDC domain-containing protein [Ruthenibacterium lactatiformans]